MVVAVDVSDTRIGDSTTNIKTRLILIVALLGIGAVVLAVALMQRGGTSTPATTPPPATEPGGMADTATTEATPPNGATVEPGVPAATPEPTPTLTKEEELVVEMQHHSSQSAPSVNECAEILKTEPWCSVPESAERITRPEWEEMFPQTEFFLVKGYLYGKESGGGPRNLLIVEQDGQRYTAKTFDRLLKANGVIAITDENREPVAKAFALMTIPDYLEEEIVFTEWRDVTSQSTRPAYDHCLLAWTKLGGLEVGWCFVFRNERLEIVSGPGLQQSRVGDYIDVPGEQLLPLTFQDYRFRGE